MARRRVLPDLVARLRLDATGFDNRLKDVEQSLSKTSAEVAKAEGVLDRLGKKAGISGGALKAGLLAGAGAAVTVGVDLFKTGVALEAMGAKAEKVFGSEIGNVRKWADKNAIAMGLTTRQAVGLSAGMADLLVPMGFARKEAGELSQRVIGLSGALAAWSGGQRTAAEVAEILQSAMLGEREQLKGLGISITAADVAQRLMEKGQRDLTGAALQQAEAMATVELIFEKSKDAQDAYNDSSRTTAERMNEMTARWNEAKEDLSAGFLPVVVTLTEKLNNYIESTFHATEATKGLQGVGADLGAALYDVFHAIDQKAITTLENLGRTIDQVDLLRRALVGNEAGRQQAIDIYSRGGVTAGARPTDAPGGGNWSTTNNFHINGVTDHKALASVINRELDWHNRGPGRRAI